ncbi:MAG: hypothetical protein ACYTXY_41535 [Nostoc sp.]
MKNYCVKSRLREERRGDAIARLSDHDSDLRILHTMETKILCLYKSCDRSIV